LVTFIITHLALNVKNKTNLYPARGRKVVPAGLGIREGDGILG